jgi:predicted DNA-binding transcriptional regulator AlpA
MRQAMNLRAIVEIIQSRPLLRRKDLARRLGVDDDTIDRWHKKRKLPAAIYFPGCRFPLWRPGDVEAWETRNKKRK